MSGFEGVEDPSPTLCLVVVVPSLAASVAACVGVLIVAARALGAVA